MAVDPLRPLRAFDRVQQRHRWLAIPVAVLKKFADDKAASQAALLAYYAFFSLFPLLLVFVTVLGFVLKGDPSAQEAVQKSVLGHFPVVGGDLHTKSLQGGDVALIVGILVALWAGLGVTQAAQNAFNNVWAVPMKDRPDFLRSRLHGLVLVMCLGVLFLISTGASGLVAAGLGGAPLKVAGIILSLALNFVMFAAAFRLLTAAAIPTRSLWIGAVVGGIVWELLQLLGGYYVSHVVSRAENTNGFFATRYRSARVAAPRRAGDAVRGGDQRGGGAAALAAQPLRLHAAERSRGARGAREGGAAKRPGGDRGPLPTVSALR